MYSLIIVDDDIAVTQIISEKVPFENIDITLVATAFDGFDGFNKISLLKPNIIICDITMPKMSGFEMLDKIQTIPDYNPQIIIFTGHDDFAHVRTAIKYQVSDYLIKPIMPDDLLAALDTAKKRFFKQNNLFNAEKQVSRTIFIDKLFHGGAVSDEEIQKHLAIDNNSQNHHLCISIYLTNANIETYRKYIVDYFSSHFDNLQYSVLDNNYMHLLINSATLEKDSIVRLCNNLIKELPFKENLFICISRFSESVYMVPELIKQNNKYIQYSFCFNESTVLDTDEIISYINTTFTSDVCANLEAHTKSPQIHNIDACYNFFDDLKNRVCQFSYYEPDYIKHIFYTAVINIYNQTISVILDDVSYDEDDNQYQHIWQKISSAASFSDMLNVCIGITQRFFSTVNAKSANKSENLLELIQDYINKHYMENISLDSVAQSLYISPRHLIRILSNNNSSFRNYLLQTRMKNAKKLLLENNYKIYEVAQMVGYKDVKTFRESFNNYFGISPSKISKLK